MLSRMSSVTDGSVSLAITYGRTIYKVIVTENQISQKKGNQLMRKPTSKYEIQGELNRIWFKYYTKTITAEQRIKIADAFINRYCVDTSQSSEEIIENAIRAPRFDSVKKETGAYDPDLLMLNHPQFSQQERPKRVKYSLTEILSDFIIRAETDETGTVKSRELEVVHEEKSKRNNLHIFHGDADKEFNKEAGEQMPAGYITEDEYVMQMVKPRKPITAHQVKAELSRVKQYSEFYATTFAEDYGKDYDDAIRRIRRLDLDRVRTCHQCEDGFYARDLRRKICDRQNGILNGGEESKLSACELNYKRREEMWRKRIERQR